MGRKAPAATPSRWFGVAGMARACLVLVLLVGSVAGSERAPVVVLGFDGADARLTRELLEAGELPHLAQLAREGSFRPLVPTNPPQTPVSWSTFATGLDPGSTRIFDFLKRDLSTATPIPSFALMEDDQREQLLWGEASFLVTGGIAFVALLLLVAAGGILARRGWRRSLVFGLVLGALAGSGVGWATHLWIPPDRPVPVNNRWGRTFWDMADAAGLRSQIVRVPATFPASHLDHGDFLSGLGVPDVRATIGQPALYVTGGDVVAGGDFSVRIETLEGDGPWSTHVLGPRNVLFYAPGRTERNRRLEARGVPRDLTIPLEIERSADGIILRLDGREESLAPGQWSSWYEPTFAFNPLLRLRTLFRFHLLALDPHLRLYLSPVQFHPETASTVPFAHPAAYAETLYEEGGPFRTLGWAIDTWTISERMADEEHFLEDAWNTADRYEAILHRNLEAGDFDLYVQVFNFTDRIGHILWRFEDPGHPQYDPERAPRYREALRDAYRRMDRIVGEARERLPDDAVLIVLSDHGFASYRRGFNINTWLVRNGYMDLKGQGTGRKTLDDLFGGGRFFENVDWTRTRAYALGLGALYVNLAGRERAGIVSPGREYRELIAELTAGLEAYVDPETGDRPVARVFRRDEIYSEYDPVLIPDLRVANSPNYRVSWQTTLGGVPREVVQDNPRPWSGDHCSLEPEQVPGILFTSEPLPDEAGERDLRMLDVMPTLLRLLGLDVPADRRGRPFLEGS